MGFRCSFAIESTRKSNSPWDNFTSLLGPAPKARNPEPVIKSSDNSILVTMLGMPTSVSLNVYGCDFPLSGHVVKKQLKSSCSAN